MSTQEATRSSSRISKKPQVAIMNAVHDLPVLAARDLGYFKDEGLDIDFIVTPGMSQVTTKHFVKFETVFDRPLDSVYNEGGIDPYRMCEWGIMKRAVRMAIRLAAPSAWLCCTSCAWIAKIARPLSKTATRAFLARWRRF